MPKDLSTLVAVDTETTGLDIRHGCRPFYVSTCDGNGVIRSWSWPVDPFTRIPAIPDEDREAIKGFLDGKHLIMHNHFFDILALSSINIRFSVCHFPFQHDNRLDDRFAPLLVEPKSLDDTQLLAHAFASDEPKGLKELGIKWLHLSDQDEKHLKHEIVVARRIGRDQDWFLGETLRGTKSPSTDMWMVAPAVAADPSAFPSILFSSESLSRYADRDAVRTVALWMLWSYMLNEARNGTFPTLREEYAAIEYGYRLQRWVMESIDRTQSEGLPIDLPLLQQRIEDYSALREERFLTAQVNLARISGRPIGEVNPNSDDQLREALFTTSKLPVAGITKKSGKASTSTKNLQVLQKRLATDPPSHLTKPKLAQIKTLIDSLIGTVDAEGKMLQAGANQLTTAIGYLQNYDVRCLPVTNYGHRVWKLFPSLNSTGTRGVRLSSSNPNGQNIAAKSTFPLRDLFIASFSAASKRVLIDLDYDQLELRIFAALAGENELLEAFDQGLDIHAKVASRMFNKPIEEITPAERRSAKYVNFGIIYGAGEPRIDREAGFKGAYALFTKQFTKVRPFLRGCAGLIESQGYVLTAGGYPLHVPYDYAYKAANVVVQGTAGEIAKIAMQTICDRKLLDENCRMLLQVHDELLFDVDNSDPQATQHRFFQLRSAMEFAGGCVGIKTPVDGSILTESWGSKTACDITDPLPEWLLEERDWVTATIEAESSDEELSDE